MSKGDPSASVYVFYNSHLKAIGCSFKLEIRIVLPHMDTMKVKDLARG